MSYNPGTFRDLADSQLGLEIYEELVRPEIVIAMETASRLGRPAVEGIEDQLLQKFGELILEPRTKQMVGHMVRQILEERGWRLDQAEVKVHSVPFIKGARYKRSDAIELYVYRNSVDPRDVAVTATRSTVGLPDEGRWIFYATIDSRLKAAVFGLRNLDLVLTDIKDHGFHRARIERMLRAGR